MRKGDVQLGKPGVLYTGTKAGVEAITGLAEGAHAYSTDTDEYGVYDGTNWIWGSGTSFSADYGSFSSSATQTMLNTATAYAITYTDTEISNGVTVSNNSRINISSDGTYLITFSAIGKSTVANKTLDIWLSVDGANVPRSNTLSRFVGSGNERIITVTYIYSFLAGQYFELYMHSDDTGTTIIATAAAAGPPARPASPSIIVTVNKISNTVAPDSLLLEDGDYLLLEDGDLLSLE